MTTSGPTPCSWSKEMLTKHFLDNGWLTPGEFIADWEIDKGKLTLHLEREGKAENDADWDAVLSPGEEAKP